MMMLNDVQRKFARRVSATAFKIFKTSTVMTPHEDSKCWLSHQTTCRLQFFRFFVIFPCSSDTTRD